MNTAWDMIPRPNCLSCGKKFIQLHKNQKYCCPGCRSEYQHSKYISKRQETAIKKKKCAICNTEFVSKASNHKYCSPDCQQAAQQILYQNNKYLILCRDEFRCAYCGMTSYRDHKDLHLDHIIPKSRGGPDSASNLITACTECNLGKSASELSSILANELLEEVSKRNVAANIHPDKIIKLNGRNP